jgi:hypothetical protein
MKSELKLVHTCDFCKKYSTNKGSITRHQKGCSNNPANKTACLGILCKHLGKTKIEGSTGYLIDVFYCNKLNKKVYYPNAKHKGCLHRYPDTFKDQEPMPTECEHFKISGLIYEDNG